MRLLALIMALLLVCLPSVASAKITAQEAADHFKWAGAGDDLRVLVRTQENPDSANGVFIAPGCYFGWFIMGCTEQPMIVLFQGDNVPDDMMYHVAFHEFTHYLQWKNRQWFPDGPYDEWDADAGSVNMMCQAGFDGVGVMQRWMEWVNKKLGYYGDEDHGSTTARFTYARAHAPACEVAPQAP